MPEADDEDDLRDDNPVETPSKSAQKRRMLALQQLGESLLDLTEKQLAKVPIADERLLQALGETRRIRSHGARKRHLQFIGKLMRDLDSEPIERALRELHQHQRQRNDSFHQLEQLRDAVLAAGEAGIEQVLQRWPAADRQQLRQLLLQHRRDAQRGKPPAASRKLLRYLRELQELYGEPG
ncbi:MAG: DUF615 domain-containing protein [Halioglobus sp.]|nr:DUF615 domain-containing protein [Halioglobus sp.]